MLAGLASILSSLARGEMLVKRTSLGVPALLLGALLVAGTLRNLGRIDQIVEDVGFGTTPIGFFRDTALRGLQYLLLAFLVGWSVRERREAHVLAHLFGVSTLLLGGFYIAVFSLELLGAGDLNVARHEVGVTIRRNVNELAAMMAFPLAIGLTMWGASPKGGLVRLFWSVVSGVAFTAMIATFSRSGFAAIAFIVLSLIWLRNRHVLALFVLAAVLIPLGVAELVADRVMYGLDSGDANMILTGRLDNIWTPIVPEILQAPLVGAGRYAILFTVAYQTREIQEGLHDPHSAYLEQFLDGGLLGFLLIAVFYVMVLRRTVHLARHATDPQARAFATGFGIALVGFALQGLTGLSFYPDDASILLWTSFAVLLAFLRVQMAFERTSHVADRPTGGVSTSPTVGPTPAGNGSGAT